MPNWVANISILYTSDAADEEESVDTCGSRLRVKTTNNDKKIHYTK